MKWECMLCLCIPYTAALPVGNDAGKWRNDCSCKVQAADNELKDLAIIPAIKPYRFVNMCQISLTIAGLVVCNSLNGHLAIALFV